MNKIYSDATSALAGVVQNGQTIAVGGFGLCGIPEALMAALRDSGVTGLTAISKDYYEAAEIDATSKWRQFTHITLPLLQPTLAVVLILSTIEAFKVYELVVSLTGGGPGKSTVYLIQTIYDTAFRKTNQAGVAAAQSAVLFVILLALTVGQLRISKSRT